MHKKSSESLAKQFRERVHFLKDKRIRFFILSTFLTTLAYSIVSPIRSIYISSFNIDLFQLGILFTISTVIQIILDSPFGTLTDHLSRTKIMTICLVVNVFLFFIQTVANSFDFFIWIFILEGIFTALYNISLWSYMNDTLKKTGLDYPAISVIWMIPGMIGPYIGGALGVIDNRIAFFAAAGVEVAAFVFSMLVPKITDKKTTVKDAVKEAVKGVYVDEFRTFAKTNRNVKISTFFDSVLSYDGNIFYSFIPIYMSSFFGMDEFWIGVFFSAVEFIAVAVRGIESFFFRKIIKKKLIISMAVLTAICYIAIPFVGSLSLFITLVLAASFASYMIYPLTYHVFINALPKYKRGEVVGANQTISDVGGTIGNFIGGAVSNASGVPFALFTSGILYGLGSGLATLIRRTPKRQKEVNKLEREERRRADARFRTLQQNEERIRNALNTKK